MSRSLIAALLMSAGAAFAQPTYQVTPIPPPPLGTQAGGRGVNNFGHVTGWCMIGGSIHVFVYTPAAGSSDLAMVGPGNAALGGYGINDSDVIVGQFNSPSGQIHAFLWDGVLHDIT